VSEKSNPFKGIPSLFSRSSKKHDKVAHQKSIADGNPSVASKSSESQLSEDGRKLIADSNLFDASWYLRQNPDVAAAQIAPLEHYFTCGESEGRNPGPDFDVAWYTGKYPEFVATGFGALEHYLRFGCLESKSISLADYRRKLESDPELSGEHRALRSAAVKVYTSPPLARRINLVVDSMFLKRSGKQPGNNSSSESIDANENLDSNNSRGLQIAVLLSAATEASLRVVTRVKSAEVSSFKNFLLADNLPVPEHVEFVHCDYLNSVVSLPVSRWDVFITVDEPNDASIRCSIDEKNIFALAPTAKSQQIIGDNLAATLVDLTRRCESVFV
jgi:hypothetical protein